MQFEVEVAKNTTHQLAGVLQNKRGHHAAQLFNYRTRRRRFNSGNDQAVHLPQQRVILRAGEFCRWRK